MSNFGLISSVINIARRNSESYTPTIQGASEPSTYSKPIKNLVPLKVLTDFQTLDVGDEIIDREGNVRKVKGFTIGKKTGRTLLILSGLKKDGKKTFNWSQDKLDEAIRTKGFRLRL